MVALALGILSNTHSFCLRLPHSFKGNFPKDLTITKCLALVGQLSRPQSTIANWVQLEDWVYLLLPGMFSGGATCLISCQVSNMNRQIPQNPLDMLSFSLKSSWIFVFFSNVSFIATVGSQRSKTPRFPILNPFFR